VRACTVERAQAMRAACERQSLRFSEEVFESRLLGIVNRLAAEKGLTSAARSAQPRGIVSPRPGLA
jgi:hypothetical protein